MGDASRVGAFFSSLVSRNIQNYGFYITKFKYHLCYYLNLFAILAKGTVR